MTENLRRNHVKKLVISFVVILFSLSNCKNDISSVGPDPSEPLWGYWRASFQMEEPDIERWLIFQQDETVKFYEHRSGENAWWNYGTYIYDLYHQNLLILWYGSSSRELITYEGGDSFIYAGRSYSKQTEPPEWAK